MGLTPPSTIASMIRAENGCEQKRTAVLARAAVFAVIVSALTGLAVPAAAQKVRASNFSDVSFGMLGNLQADSRRSQNLCVYSSGHSSSYTVSASGSGSGSAFTLSDGSFLLPYEVHWSDSANQSTGISLAPNIALTGQQSSAINQFCSPGPAVSASLTVVLRSADLSRATAGTYSGSLTVLISAE